MTQSQAVCVYTKNACQPCIRTKKELALRGVTFTEVNVEEDAKALAYIKSLGHQGAPVIVLSGGDSWSGMRPDKINEHFGKRPTK